MRVGITGGGGFVGKHLLAELAERQPDAVLSAPSRAQVDLREPSSVADWVAEFRPERVFHLGALTSPRQAALEPELAELVNVGGTRALCQALLEHTPETRLVHVSTCHVYGVPQRVPVTEAHPLLATGAYALSKVAAEGVVRQAVEQGLDAVIVRPFNLMGPGQSTEYALADWALQSLGGSQHILCGDIELQRDYLDVRDAAAGLHLLAQRALSSEAYNLCSGEAVPLRWLMALVAPGGAPHVVPARLRASPVKTLQGSRRKAGALGWEPAVSLEQSAVDLRIYLSSRRSI